MKNQPIGILDSGVGGLSIWREIIKKLPHESTIYLADSANCPYGEKTAEEIYKLSKRMVKFFLEKKVKLIILACNTITVTCLDKLRQDFPKIPIIGIVPVIKTASELTKNGRIGVLSTRRTANSRYQKELIKKFAKGLKVLNLGTDKLVPLIERGESFGIIKMLGRELKAFQDFKVDVLVLGCSHFPFLKRKIRRIMGEKIKILDSAGAVARQVKRILIHNSTVSFSKKPFFLFYTTGNHERFREISAKLVGKKYGKMIKSVKRIRL